MSDVINKELQLYIEQHIIPQYDLLDESHSSIHVEQVIQNSFEIMASYQVNQDMVYTVAAFHDIGMLYGRKLHEVKSKEIFESDEYMRIYFSLDEIRIIGEQSRIIVLRLIMSRVLSTERLFLKPIEISTLNVFLLEPYSMLSKRKKSLSNQH